MLLHERTLKGVGWGRGATAAVIVAAALACAPPAGPRPELLGLTTSGESVDLLRGAEEAVVLIFVAPDCPISNRYVPEINRIYDDYRARGVDVYVVYTDTAFTPAQIEAHGRDFALQPTALLDFDQQLRRRAMVDVTPEAAIFGADGRRLYGGRIDNRWVSFGRFRPAATEHDLRLALDAILRGETPQEPAAPPIGCFIPSLDTA